MSYNLVVYIVKFYHYSQCVLQSRSLYNEVLPLFSLCLTDFKVYIVKFYHYSHCVLQS